MKRGLWAAGAAAGLILGMTGAAQATDYVRNVTGDFSQLVPSSFPAGGTTFFVGSIGLTGFGDAIDLQQGDSITLNITIANGPFTIGSYDNEFLGVNFQDASGNGPPGPPDADPEPPSTVAVDGFMSFDGGAPQVANCGNCLSLLYSVSQTPLSFTTLQAITDITTLQAPSAPFEVSQVTLSYQLNDNAAAVPEPVSWALMLLGFGGLGAQLRLVRRRMVQTAA